MTRENEKEKAKNILLIIKAKKKGIKVSEEEIDNYIKKNKIWEDESLYPK